MKKTIYYAKTNGYDFLMTDDGKTRRVLSNEYAQCEKAEGGYMNIGKFVNAVEDDSSWEEYKESAEELLEDAEVIYSTEIEL